MRSSAAVCGARCPDRAMTITPDYAAAFIIIFARVGALVMLLPGIGEQMILNRAKLALALLITLVLYTTVRPRLPALAGGLVGPGAVGLLLSEIIVGLMIGLATRMIVASLQTAGAIVAQELGLSYAQTVNPAFGGTDTSISNFITLLGLALIFATDLHHLAIAAISASYSMLPPGGLPPPGDATQLALKAVARGFKVAVQIASPFIVFGLLFNLGLGLLARLMPQLQVFFLALPATILIGMAILLAVIGLMMGLFLGDLRDFLMPLVTG
jgi:flagellar biosynthetic protein FliR